MKNIRKLILPLIIICLSTSAYADDFPRQEDVSTIDGIMKAYYEVVSRKAGEPTQSARDISLHLPASQVIRLRENSEGEITLNRMTIDEFHEPAGQVNEVDFKEYEISRKVMYHGNQALVWSTYEITEGSSDLAPSQGINSIQLYNDGKRWWIVAEIWDARKGQEVSKEYLP